MTLNGTNDIPTKQLNRPISRLAKPGTDWRFSALNLYPGKNFGNREFFSNAKLHIGKLFAPTEIAFTIIYQPKNAKNL